MAFADYIHCPVCIAGHAKHGWFDPSDGTTGRDAWPGYKMMYVGGNEVPDGMVAYCHKHAPKFEAAEAND